LYKTNRWTQLWDKIAAPTANATYSLLLYFVRASFRTPYPHIGLLKTPFPSRWRTSSTLRQHSNRPCPNPRRAYDKEGYEIPPAAVASTRAIGLSLMAWRGATTERVRRAGGNRHRPYPLLGAEGCDSNNMHLPASCKSRNMERGVGLIAVLSGSTRKGSLYRARPLSQVIFPLVLASLNYELIP
jgi:hypothetical protein